MESDLVRDRAEAGEQIAERGGSHVEDGVAIASEPLELAVQVRAALRVEHHAHARMALAQRRELACLRPARQAGAVEVAQHEARLMACVSLAVPQHRLLASLERDERLEGAVAV